MYFDSFGEEPPEELKNRVKWRNIYRIQDLNAVTCGHFCIDFMNSVNSNKDYFKWLCNYDIKKLKKMMT